MLLWINTILTALILPLLGFVGSRLWNQVDDQGVKINDVQRDISVMKDRVDRMLVDVPELRKDVDFIKSDLTIHLKTKQP